MSRKYTPSEVAVIILKKSEELIKSAMGGLKTAKLTPVPGVVSPTQSNTATPGMVGAQAVVKQAKPKKMGQATDKPSVFFKTEENQQVKQSSIQKLKSFLEKHRTKQ